jgi:archaemetzincin
VKGIQLLPMGSCDSELLSDLAGGLAKEFEVRCELQAVILEPASAYNLTRQQYSSTEILALLASRGAPDTWHVLAVTSRDLYIPILTFVFGEAQVGGSAAVVSLHRLRDEFYGLPPNVLQLRSRLLKEAMHELGHTLTLSHCEDYQCVMSASHGVEWIDLKGSHFCRNCQTAISTQAPPKLQNDPPLIPTLKFA